MVTNKKRLWRQLQLMLVTAMIGWCAGCSPAGPRALLRGKRLVEEGKYAEAVPQLKQAVSLMATNAQAWNYLGLAYHHAGDAPDAVDAYQRALKLNHDLVVVHYNLGCVLLEENKPETLEGARNEFTAFTLHQRNSVDGWLKLGTVQLRLGELVAADASFREVLRLNPANAEAMNDLGVIQLQRKRWRDAATCFNNALKLQPNYGPALLNLAVTDIYQGNRSQALQAYRDYLDLSPRGANWDAVNSAATQLDQELNPPPPRPATNAMPVISLPPTNTAVVRTDAVASLTRPPIPTPVPAPAPAPVTNAPPQPAPIPATVPAPEVVRVPEPPMIRTAETGLTPAVPAPRPPPSSTEVIGTPPAELPPPPAATEKRSFFQRLNPMTLFRRDPKPANTRTNVVVMIPPIPAPANPPPTPSPATNLVERPKPIPVPVMPATVARYPYLPVTRPVPGNRAEAERLSAQGGEAQRDHRLKDAIAFYRAASQADPSYFEAFTGLGATAAESGSITEAARAYELGLVIRPDSFDARFNFGLALKRANYIVDAAQELEKLLVSSAGRETPARLALAHLTLGNLYAEEFNQPASARPHYLKVLELDPANSQSTAIRFWLQGNP